MIKKSSSGRIVKMPEGYDAFIPHSLPPKIEWSLELVTALSQADHVIGKLAGEGRGIANPHVLMRPFVMREAVLSSKIEGTQATIGELLAADAGVTVERSPEELKEVSNYVAALEYGLKRLSSLPLSLRLLREIHEKLLEGVRGDHATPGEFRTSQNWIGSLGCTLSTAKYVPPSPDDMKKCLADFEHFLHDTTFPHLIHSALCHYQFESIHPFLDGNGRVGRLLIMLLFVERGALPSPLLYLSAFFEATRKEYYQHLYSVSAHGTWNEWLLYFLKGVTLQSQDVLSRAERINNLIADWLRIVSGTSAVTS